MGSELESRHVFLSYSHDDAQMMVRIRSELESMGVSVWTDEGLPPGTKSWKTTIESKIRDASGVVVILSPNANRSEWVERELDYASVHGVKIFPVLVRGKPGESIPIELINAQWIDLRDEAGFSSQIQKLVLALEGKPGQGAILQTFELSKESIRRMYTKVPKEARVIITVAGVLILTIIAFFIFLAIISAILSALINIRLLTPREVPQAKTLHYLFIVDSSDRMAQAFPGGQSKWSATRQSVLDHLVLGLPPRANYSLIVLGGKSLPHTGSCKQRESNFLVPIGSDNREDVLAGFETLEPGGVAPLEDALEKAREVLFNLPAGEEKALYLFLGGGDDCAEDQWKSLKYFLEDSAQYIDARIEIVVLPGEDVDETVRAVSEVQELIAENALENVGVHLPKDAPALERTSVQIQDQALEDAQQSEPTAVSFQRTALVEASATAEYEARSNPPIPPDQPVPAVPAPTRPAPLYVTMTVPTVSPTYKVNTPTGTPSPSLTPTYTLPLIKTPTSTRTSTPPPTDTQIPTPTPVSTRTPTSTPTLPPAVWAALSSQPDVFSTGCPLIGQARVYAQFYRLPASISAALVSNGRTNQGLRLDYSNAREEGGEYAGWEVWLGADDYSGVNLSSYGSLVFYIRGDVGGEEPNIYLMNPTLGENYKRFWNDIEQVTTITTSWQPVVIPLLYFTSGPVPSQQVDLSNVQRIQILFEWYPQPTSGRIYIDDLCVQ